MDSLEKFIKNNKDDLRRKHPNKEALWSKIQMGLPEEKKPAKVLTLTYRFLAKAAAVILICGVVGTIYLNNNTRKSDFVMSQEMMEIDAHYKTLVHARIEQVKNNEALSNKEKKEFMNYINELEEESKNLQKELNKNLNNEKIIEAMIDNYKERLRLMEQLLNRVDKINKDEKEKNIII